MSRRFQAVDPAMSEAIILSRGELYERVWAMPIGKAAESLGVTNARLKRICERHEIPTPPVGHWTQKRFGKATDPDPLPPSSSGRLDRIRIEPAPAGVSTSFGRTVDNPEIARLIDLERLPKQRIVVPDQLDNPHPIIRRSKHAFEHGGHIDHMGLFRISRESEEECVDIAVAKTSVPRALRLMNALFRALEQRGYRVTAQKQRDPHSYSKGLIRCHVLGEQFGFRLREKIRRIKLTDEEMEKNSRLSWYDRNKTRDEPTGVFELAITDTVRVGDPAWKDDPEDGTLEGRLNDVVVGLLSAVHWERANRSRREEAERKAKLESEELERRRAAAARLQEEQERICKAEKARVTQLESSSADWEKAVRLRNFIDAIREEAIRRHGSLDGLPGFARWLEWANVHVRSIDPLGADKPLPRIDAPDDPPVAGATSQPVDRCPKCGFKYGWDGSACQHCHHGLVGG
jgi:hypothetical protein